MSLNNFPLSRKRTRSNELFLDLVSQNCNMDDDHIQWAEKDSVSEAGIPNESYDPDEEILHQLPPKEAALKETAPKEAAPEEAADSMSSSSSQNSRYRNSAERQKESDDEMSYHSGYSEQNEIEASLPSHAFKAVRGLPSNNALKQNMRRTLRERKPKLRGNLEVDGRGFSVDNDETVANEDQVFHAADLSSSEFAAFMGRNATVKEVPTSIRRKRSIRENLNEVRKKDKTKHISAWKHFQLNFAMGWQQFKAGCKELLYVMDIWGGHLKTIQGMFGSGVLSYFVLLRWLFLINLVVFSLTIFFLVIPQMVYQPSFENNSASFRGWELLTGDGYFTKTELYYGSYTNKSIPMSSNSELVYKMPLAYLCVGGGYLLLCLAILVYSMAESYRENYIYAGDEFSFYIAKLFCAWDYGITDQESAALKQKSIYNDFKEVIADQFFHKEQSAKELCFLISIRLITNLLVVALIGGGSFLIYFCSTNSFTVDAGEFDKLLFPIIVSALNLVLPVTFRIIASLEQYQHPRTTININLARTVLLKLTSLGVVLIALFSDVTICRKGQDLGDKKCLPEIKECWETHIGISFYRLIVVDFVFLLLSTFFGEFVRSLMTKHIGWCGQNVGYPGFDISRNVLDLVYCQSLAWIGTFFSPLISAVNVLKLLFLFYIKRISVVNNCKVSGRPFRAAKMNLLFLVLLGVAFLVSIITVGYTVMSESENMLKPSKNCGPFRELESMYSVITAELRDFPSELKIAIEYLSSASFLAMLFCILGIVVYYYKMLKDSNEKKIKLLKEQIALAGQDKLYLMRKITTGVAMADVNVQPSQQY